MKKVLEQRIAKLISFESTEKNSAKRKACAAWIMRELKTATRGLSVRVETVTHNGVESVVAMRGTWKKPDVLLNAHYDVVGGKKHQFSAIKKGDKIYGRGAADMKGGVASMMTVFIESLRANPTLSLGIMITGDEEIGGKNGASWLATQGWKPKLFLNFDGGYGEELTHAEKGILWLSISATGKTALTTYAWEADNAFEKIVHATQTLNKIFPNTRKATREDNWYTTWASTTVAANSPRGETVADTALMEAGVHFIEDTTPEKLLKKIQKALPQCTVKADFMAPRVWMPASNPQIKRFQKIYARELGHTPRIRGENGSSDARFFTHLNIPIIITKPLGGNPELDGEWVSLKSVEKLTRATIQFLAEYKTKNRQ